MRYKKGFFIICLIACLISAASVVAGDINETSIASDEQSDEILSVECDEENDAVATEEFVTAMGNSNNDLNDTGLKLQNSGSEKYGDANSDGSAYYIKEDSYNELTYKDSLTLKFQSSRGVADEAHVMIYKGDYESWDDYWNEIDVTLGDDGYYTLKLKFPPDEYSIDVYDGNNNYLAGFYLKVVAYYGPEGYKNMKITSAKAYYCQEKDIVYSWDGIFNGYLKVYRGKSLVDKFRLDNRDDGSVRPGGYEFLDIYGYPAGVYKTKIVDMKGKVVAQSTFKVLKTPTKIKVKSLKVKPGSKKYVVAKVYEKSCGEKHWGGKVKFKIMGKTYKVKVKKGIAKIKIKIPSKIKTYTCKAIFSGDKNALKSSVKFKIVVKKPASKYKVIKTYAKKYWITKKSGKFTVETKIWDMTAGFMKPYKYIDTTLFKSGKQVKNTKYSVKYKINGKWTGWTKYGTIETAHHRYAVKDSASVGQIKVKVLK